MSEPTERSASPKAQPRLRKPNLVFLSIVDGEVTLEETLPHNVSVNLTDGTWQLTKGNTTRKYQIGQASPLQRGEGLYGVYDRTNVEHLKALIDAPIEKQEADDPRHDDPEHDLSQAMMDRYMHKHREE